MRQKRQNKNKKKWLRIILSLLFLFGLSFLIIQVVIRFRMSWSGNEQISFGLESESGEVLIVTLTPAKDMAVVTRIPGETIIETPWFGNYTVNKLYLLVNQEENENIFNRSLSYYLGLPVDFGYRDFNFKKDFELSFLKNELSAFFFPPKNITHWRVWRYLKIKDLVWKTIDLSDYGQLGSLADGSEVFLVDPDKIDQQLWAYFSDPLIKGEDISLSIFNAGGKSGLAKKISALCKNIGIRVVEVGDQEEINQDCLLIANDEKLLTSYTVKRLHRLLGCNLELGNVRGLGNLNLIIKNVKIN